MPCLPKELLNTRCCCCCACQCLMVHAGDSVWHCTHHASCVTHSTHSARCPKFISIFFQHSENQWSAHFSFVQWLFVTLWLTDCGRGSFQFSDFSLTAEKNDMHWLSVHMSNEVLVLFLFDLLEYMHILATFLFLPPKLTISLIFKNRGIPRFAFASSKKFANKFFQFKIF